MTIFLDGLGGDDGEGDGVWGAGCAHVHGGVQGPVTGFSNEVTAVAGAKNGENEVRPCWNSRFSEGLAGICWTDVSEGGEGLGGFQDASDSDGGVDDELGKFTTSFDGLGAEESVDNSDGALEVLAEVLQTFENGLWEDFFRSLCQGHEDASVQKVIHCKGCAVDFFEWVRGFSIRFWRALDSWGGAFVLQASGCFESALLTGLNRLRQSGDCDEGDDGEEEFHWVVFGIYFSMERRLSRGAFGPERVRRASNWDLYELVRETPSTRIS